MRGPKTADPTSSNLDKHNFSISPQKELTDDSALVAAKLRWKIDRLATAENLRAQEEISFQEFQLATLWRRHELAELHAL